MPTRIRSKTGEGIDSQIMAFYEANPDEELTYDDIAAKFGTTRNHAFDVVRLLRMRGDLEYVQVVRLAKQEMP